MKFAWFLVIDDLEKILNEDNKPMGNENTSLRVVTKEPLIYTVGAIIPLIITNSGVHYIVKVKETHIRENNSLIIFDLVTQIDPDSVISDHYLSIYNTMNRV